MSSFRDNPALSITSETNETPDVFRRKLLSNRQWSWPRRYVMAFLLFILLLIRSWRNMNVMFTLAHVIVLEDSAHEKYPAIGNWTLNELEKLNMASIVVEIFAQIPGALLLFIYSSHKYLLASAIGTSVFQMLTPTALNHHSASLLVVLISHTVVDAPIRVAVISILRDWAPPAERTRIIVFATFGILAGCAVTTFYPYLFHYIINEESYYFAGITGLIWALFWYNIASDTPQNDPLISEKELIYLQTSIPSDVQQVIELRNIPWKSIMTSKQIQTLCLIFFKMGCSIQTIMTCGTFFAIYLSITQNPIYLFISFSLSFMIIVPCSAVLADFLIKRFTGRTLLIRKGFLCGGFILQCIFMFATISSSVVVKTVFYMISYLCFAASMPGFVTLILDLSPRYVAIIAGIVYTFYISGFSFIQYFMENTIDILDLQSVSWVFLFDGIISVICVCLFFVWGDVDEQFWSLNFRTGHRMSSGYKSYPKPEDQDDTNLVPENA